MPAKRPPAAAAVLVVAVSALTACHGGGHKSPGTTAAGGGGPSAGAVDINPVARNKVADGGTLHWPLNQIPPNLNYNEVDGTLADTANVVDATLPELFSFDGAAVPSLNRNYLESAELTSRDPKQVVTYRINPKASWSDGTPITEADFEAQWKANSGTAQGYRISSANGYEQVESVAKGGDDREVVVTFAQPYADWKGIFSPLYPASTNNDATAYNEGWVGKMPVTAGPFRFEGVDETA
ncbi:MAG TPA: ABC transporter substrate-binding protein, partial [Acidimicrobiia bacterium]